MMTRNRIVSGATGASRTALALALLAGISPALAQTAPETAGSTPSPEAVAAGAAAGPGAGIDEIVVTAQFREQNLQQTPLAITAVSSAMLEARSQTNIVAVADQAPSVTLKPQGAAFGPSLGANIRGVGQFDFNPAVEPGVGLYVDDVYYATLTGSVFDLLDLDRVEVLRGPQGTLAGRNSIGGAIKLYSKKPTGSNTGTVQATYGIRDRIDLRGSADFKLTEHLFARVSGAAKKQDGYVKQLDFACVNPPGSALNPAVGGVQPTGLARGDCVISKQGDVDFQAVRGQLRWEPSDRLEVNVAGDYTKDAHNVAGTTLLSANNAAPQVRGTATAVPYDSRFLCGRYCNYATFTSPAGSWLGPVATGLPLSATRGAGRTDFEGWGVSGIIDFKLTDDMAIKSITAYRAYTTIFSNDDDASPLPIGNGFGDLTFWSVSQELRLNGTFADGMFNYTVGGFYMDQRSKYFTRQDIRYAAIPLQFQGTDPVNADTKAAFAQLSANLTEKLTVTGGIRYTEEHKDYTFERRNYNGTVNPFLGTLNGQTGNYNGDRVDYRANVQYQWSPAVMTYAQISTGFKGGGINPRPFNPAQVVSFNPETLTAYEGGIKTTLFDRKMRFNVAGYYSDYKDIQLTLLSCPQFGGPGPCAAPQNAGNARIAGAEAEVSYRPVPELMFDASLSYIDFKYKSINPAAGGPTNPGGVQLGNVPPFTPKWKWSAGISYDIDLGGSGTLIPRVDANFQDTVFTNAANGPLNRIGSYTLANARLTWRNDEGDLEISGEVTNLFDKYYLLTSFDLTGAGSGIQNGQPGRPREWAVTVKKRF